MVDKKTDLEGQEGSLLKAAVVGTPLAAGAGYSLYQSTQEFTTAARESPVQRAARALDQIQSERPRPINPKAHIQWMNKQAKFFAGEGAAIAKTAWEQAYSAADPLARKALGPLGETIKGMDAKDIHMALTQVMSDRPGDLAQSVYRRFYQNVQALTAQQFAGDATYTYKGVPDMGFGSAINALTMDENIQQRIYNIEKRLGSLPGSTYQKFISRDMWIDEGLGTHLLRFRAPGIKGDIKMMLPVTSEGVLVEGLTQQTKRIAPEVGVLDPSTGKLRRMSRTEFLLEEFEKSILPDIETGRLKTRREVERAMSQMHQRVIQQLESVPNVPAQYQTAAGRLYEKIRGQALDIVVEQERYPGEGPWRYLSAFRTPSEDEMAKVMAKEGFFAGVSPTGLAKGRVMTMDLSQLRLAPEAMSWARRPEGAYRQYGLTDEALESMNTKELERYLRYQKYDTEALRTLQGRAINPSLKAVYIDPEKYIHRMEALEMGEGEALARKGIRDFMEFEASKTKKLASVREDLLPRLMAGEVPDIRPGEVIGWSTEGETIKMTRNMRILRGIAHANENEGTFMMLHYMDTRRMTSNDKLFGDLKAVTRLMDDNTFDKFMRGLAKNQRITEEADILISMDELRKDPDKHVRQMTSAMGEILERRQAVVTKPLTEFQRDPESITKILRKLATDQKRNIYHHERYIEEMMKFAVKEADVSASEFGAIFGAVPAVLEDKDKALAIMKRALGDQQKLSYIREMFRGVAGGIASVTYSGPAEITGAGAMGSIEPRIFEVLSGSHYGQTGAAIADDLARRVSYTTPEKKRVHEALGKTLLSMEGKVGPGMGSEVWKAGKTGYDYDMFQKWIEKGGGWLDPGRGFHPVYVPGSETIRAMRPYETVGGLKIHGDLAHIFHRLARQSDEMYKVGEAIGSDQMNQELESAARALQKHWAPAGKGMGGWMRGKVVGSRFLRGVSRSGRTGMTELAAKSENLMVAGIPRNIAEEMFEEMRISELWDRDKLKAMRESAMAGEEFGGLLVRHPIFGEFSAQQMRFKVIDTPGNEIVLPEKTIDISVRRAAGGVDQKRIRLGPLVGLAGDKDADIFSAMLVSPDQEQAVKRATLAADSEFMQRYTQHQVRYQLLKGKAGGETLMSIQEKMIADARKLGTTQRWVPKLSVELSAAKRALGAFGKGAGAADAAMLLEWLEQTPISAKHLTAAEIKSGRLEGILSEVTHALKMGDQKALENAVRNIVKNNAIAGELLTGNVQLEKGAEEIANFMGGQAQRNINGINIERTIRTLMNAMHQYRITGEARRAEILASRGSGMALREIPEVVAKHASHMAAGTQGVFASVSRAATKTSSTMAALGKGLIKNHKALGLGFAGSLAIGAVLSSPSEQIGSGGNLIPKDINLRVSKGANRMRPEDVMPPQQSLGTPTPPNMLAARRAMISGAGQHPQMVVRARSNYMVNSHDLASRLANVSGGRGPVNVNLRDNKSSISQHIAANKML